MRRDLARRLATLEAQTRRADYASLSDLDREWFMTLCASAWSEAAWQFAGILAERRYWHAAGVTAPHSGDWLDTVSPADRTAATDDELMRLEELMRGNVGAPFADVLAQWVGVADAEGWPALQGVMFTLDGAGFARQEQRYRDAMDVSRGSDMPAAIAWRRTFPQWRPGMSGDDALAMDVMVLRARDELEAA